jgi:hypothetical protein
MPGITLVPVPVQPLSGQAELDNEIAGEILRLDLAAFFLPKANEGSFIVAHDDARVRAADEVAAIGRFEPRSHATLPAIASAARRMVPVTSDARSKSRASMKRRSSPPEMFCAVSSRIAVT